MRCDCRGAPSLRALAAVVAAFTADAASTAASLAAAAGFGGAAPPGDVAKQVVSTPWWPPGTEKKSESVGIISHGFVYMTGMMEANATLPATAEAELSDVRDIAQAAGADLTDLVDCLVNAPVGGAAVVRDAVGRALLALGAGKPSPALTVIEAPGEYPFFSVSMSCVASLPGAPLLAVREGVAYGVAARGLLHLQAAGGALAGAGAAFGYVASPTARAGGGGESSALLAAVEALVKKAGGGGLVDVAECTVFVRKIHMASGFRQLLTAALPAWTPGPALTIVQAGLEPGQDVALRCVASVAHGAGTSPAPAVSHVPGGGAVVAHRFVYASGQLDKLSNGTEAFRSLDEVLGKAGVGLSDVVSCVFFVRHQLKVFDLFNGFYDAFNVRHPPPPTRDELQAVSECDDCEVAARCVAALPVAALPTDQGRKVLVV